MNTLLIGSGGREHALAYAVYNSKSNHQIYCTPGNPGILEYSEIANVNVKDHLGIVEFCKNKKINLVLIGPEQPLADGLADDLRQHGINVFGPGKNAARLESSKGYAKDFMKKYNIPTADYKIFNEENKKDIIDYLKRYEKYPLVLKADGLAAGKGVTIANSKIEALNEVELMFSGKFGKAGKSIVVEEFLQGEEASVLAVSDGKKFVTLASSQDHKRIYDGDKGPNTGGMGAYSPAPVVNNKVMELVKDTILKPAINGMLKEGNPFIGCLYAGLMIKDEQPKVVEFNVRFGDPETQAVVMNFKGDFLGLLHSASVGSLDLNTIENECSGHTCCVVMASKGYPNNYTKGQTIEGIDKAIEKGAIVFHAGTIFENDKLKVAGGRVLGVTSTGNTLEEAVKKAYQSVEIISFENSYYRKDIAYRGIEKGGG
jgi:phosphoribosylamine---glycine ligase